MNEMQVSGLNAMVIAIALFAAVTLVLFFGVDGLMRWNARRHRDYYVDYIADDTMEAWGFSYYTEHTPPPGVLIEIHSGIRGEPPIRVLPSAHGLYYQAVGDGRLMYPNAMPWWRAYEPSHQPPD